MKDKQIPEQNNGGLHDTVSEKCFGTEVVAKDQFQLVKSRFFEINHWQKFAGEMTANFQLFDTKAKRINRKPQLGDFVKIEIPGPGNRVGDGADWVKIVEMNEEKFDFDERCFMRFRPTNNPMMDSIEKDSVAHFFSQEASSNFLIYRKAHCIYAQIHGRNEVNNTSTEQVSDKIRNVIVGVAGKMGLGKIQWKLLTDGFLNYESSIKKNEP